MAISRAMVSQLILQAKKQAFSGHALQLGKQDIWVDDIELQEVASRCSFQLKCDGPPDLVPSQFLKGKPVVSDTYFFKSLGFDDVSSLDASDFEGATLVHDLNKAPIPETLVKKFDVIYELGTIEHIFHLPNALANIHSMLKVGGYVVHASPCSNAFQHGFYMFSPCFFFDYYSKNGYEIVESSLIRYRLNWKNELTDFQILSCPPDSKQLAALSHIGSLDDKVYGVNVTVRKTAQATCSVVPQQGYYRDLWNNQDEDQIGRRDRGLVGGLLSFARRAFGRLEKIPLLGSMISRPVRFAVSRWKSASVLRWKKINI